MDERVVQNEEAVSTHRHLYLFLVEGRSVSPNPSRAAHGSKFVKKPETVAPAGPSHQVPWPWNTNAEMTHERMSVMTCVQAYVTCIRPLLATTTRPTVHILLRS